MGFIIKERRGSRRVAGSLPIKLVLRDNTDNAIIVGPFNGVINNISPKGVNCTIKHINFGQYHLFYSSVDKETQCLYMETIKTKENIVEIALPVKPVWFTREVEDEAMPFKIGLAFINDFNLEDVETIMKMVGLDFKGYWLWWQKLLRWLKIKKFF